MHCFNKKVKQVMAIKHLTFFFFPLRNILFKLYRFF